MFSSLDNSGILRSVAKGPHPLVHHDACVSVDQNPQEEENNRRDDHHSQRVQLVVLGETRAVEVEAGVELDADQSQDDADPVGDGLRVGLEVLQHQLQTLHLARLQNVLRTQSTTSIIIINIPAEITGASSQSLSSQLWKRTKEKPRERTK